MTHYCNSHQTYLKTLQNRELIQGSSSILLHLILFLVSDSTKPLNYERFMVAIFLRPKVAP